MYLSPSATPYVYPAFCFSASGSMCPPGVVPGCPPTMYGAQPPIPLVHTNCSPSVPPPFASDPSRDAEALCALRDIARCVHLSTVSLPPLKKVPTKQQARLFLGQIPFASEPQDVARVIRLVVPDIASLSVYRSPTHACCAFAIVPDAMAESLVQTLHGRVWLDVQGTCWIAEKEGPLAEWAKQFADVLKSRGAPHSPMTAEVQRRSQNRVSTKTVSTQNKGGNAGPTANSARRGNANTTHHPQPKQPQPAMAEAPPVLVRPQADALLLHFFAAYTKGSNEESGPATPAAVPTTTATPMVATTALCEARPATPPSQHSGHLSSSEPTSPLYHAEEEEEGKDGKDGHYFIPALDDDDQV